MNRRVLILAAAANAATAPAFGQDNPGSKTSLDRAAKAHAEKTAQIGHASLEMSDIAMQKARSSKVREFARFEHDEQTTVGEVLKSIHPELTPPAPPADVAEATEKLKRLQPGESFDREFVLAQIQGHEALRSLQEDYLKVGKNSEAENITKLILGMIKEHLMLLSDLRDTHLVNL